MSQQDQVAKGRLLLLEVAKICRDLPDSMVPSIMEDGVVEELLNSIFNTTTVNQYPTIAEFFLANKNRSALMAEIHLAIAKGSCVEWKDGNGHIAYVSPHHIQWFEDGVMITEGPERFSGFVGLYQNGRMSYAVTARGVQKDERVGPDAFHFVDIEEFKKNYKDAPLPKQNELAKPLEYFETLLTALDSDESKYQILLEENPWLLGMEYKRIHRHANLDDKSIPDFTAVRVDNGYSDIFEIKPPTMKCFRKDDGFSAEFNETWNQAERYLSFAREEADYLRRKGVLFNNPKCTIICGYNLSEDQLRKIYLKTKMNPAIHVKTYNELLVFMSSTVAIIRQIGGFEAK